MQHHNLPTEDLKTYGIIDEDLTFSKKLSADDVQKFLSGYTIVADNNKNRATFQLTDNNTQLKVIFLERDKSLSEILRNSKEKVQYTDIKDLTKSPDKWNIEKKAFIFDKENEKIVEFDFIKNAASLTAIIADKKDIQELNRYKIELQKLKNFLYDKIDQHPQIAKEISNDMNIVSREIDSVNNISGDEKQMAKSGNSKIELNVNDKDLYEDANQMIEDEEQQQEEKRKFKR
ncbi:MULTISPECIES: hypothetical protein [Chryseobacterium]|uniref:Uncharacterized protein n=2 Tax=Chryseobacterium gleum TaxID=250 RepID=A0A3S4M5E1_CHRGE|nr:MULTISPECIES: hypothetical protein [Chryseobacterium]ASE61699.1 hypothetical protein CEQ15_09425 [Chryseobacterium indologenes]AZB32249.1 hypothetical protein EG351_00425 [Chryseobacterium bernardetii]EFK33834.1 hypothetical protein HMPREF0204_12903 [Chryseobacterium gleum ATCC 35910]MDG4650857.1 hypothetical protein [Chryseobacterium arthrosphaerae]QQY34573.1 hypothetical protein I6I60_12715 [Chryseobacterium gleum]